MLSQEPFFTELEFRSDSVFHPGRGEMFIATRRSYPPALFGGAELNSAGYSSRSFRPSERRRDFCCGPGYKHLTPIGVKAAVHANRLERLRK